MRLSQGLGCCVGMYQLLASVCMLYSASHVYHFWYPATSLDTLSTRPDSLSPRPDILPPRPDTPTPPSVAAAILPFRVIRSKNNNLPVYSDYRHGRTKVYTIVRKLEGDLLVSPKALPRNDMYRIDHVTAKEMCLYILRGCGFTRGEPRDKTVSKLGAYPPL